MTAADYDKLRKQLILHEGKRRFPYRCTSGKLSIGVGFNIDDRGLAPIEKAIGRRVTLNELYSRGLTDPEIDRVLDADIAYFEERAAKYLGVTWERLGPVRQRAVIDFVFNVGTAGALRFKHAVAALKSAAAAKAPERQRLYYVECAYEMTRSLWYVQVGDGYGKLYDRAERITDMVRTGADYTR